MPARNLLTDCLAEPRRLAALDPGDWDRLLPQAREAQMLATLWDLLQEWGNAETAPEAVRYQLWGAWLLARRRATAIQWELRCLATELPETRGPPPVLLKGVAYIVRDLPGARSRLCGDIDLLVPRAAIERVERILYWSGWSRGQLDPYDEHYYRHWMHQLPPLQHRRRRSTLDLHHNILPETVRSPPDPARLIDWAEPVPGDAVFATPAPVHMVIHSAAHLFADSEWDKAVRDFYDLDRLLRHFAQRGGDTFWDELVLEAEAMACGRQVYYALRCCSRWFGTPVPPDVLARLREFAPAAPLLALVERIFGFATAARAAGPTPRLTALCRSFMFVRSHWIKMPPVMLVRHLFHKAFLSPREESS